MDARTQAVINELAHQRSSYADACANLAGEIAELREKLAAKEAEIAELKKA